MLLNGYARKHALQQLLLQLRQQAEHQDDSARVREETSIATTATAIETVKAENLEASEGVREETCITTSTTATETVAPLLGGGMNYSGDPRCGWYGCSLRPSFANCGR
jgi:hypothetical protein